MPKIVSDDVEHLFCPCTYKYNKWEGVYRQLCKLNTNTKPEIVINTRINNCFACAWLLLLVLYGIIFISKITFCPHVHKLQMRRRYMQVWWVRHSYRELDIVVSMCASSCFVRAGLLLRMQDSTLSEHGQRTWAAITLHVLVCVFYSWTFLYLLTCWIFVQMLI